MGELLKKIERRLASAKGEYFVRLDLTRKPPKKLEFKRDQITGTYVITFTGKRREILRLLRALRGTKIAKCTIRNPEDTRYLCFLADGRVIVDSE